MYYPLLHREPVHTIRYQQDRTGLYVTSALHTGSVSLSWQNIKEEIWKLPRTSLLREEVCRGEKPGVHGSYFYSSFLNSRPHLSDRWAGAFSWGRQMGWGGARVSWDGPPGVIGAEASPSFSSSSARFKSHISPLTQTSPTSFYRRMIDAAAVIPISIRGRLYLVGGAAG